MERALRYREPLMFVQLDRALAIDVEPYRAVEHEKELILFVVLVPGKVSFEESDAYDGIVHRRQRLVEPRSVRGDLGWNIDDAQRAVFHVLVILEILR